MPILKNVLNNVRYIIYRSNEASFSLAFLCFRLLLNPLAGVDEGLDPRRQLIIAAVGGVPRVLPREDRTLQVGHHGQMTAVLRADTGHVIIAAVGVCGIFGIVVFGNEIVCCR